MSEHANFYGEASTADYPHEAFVIATGLRLRIDGVDCVIKSIDHNGITTRPLTDAD